MTGSTGNCTPGSAVVRGNKVCQKSWGCGGRARESRIRSDAKISLFMRSKLLYRNIVVTNFSYSASKYCFLNDVSDNTKIAKIVEREFTALQASLSGSPDVSWHSRLLYVYVCPGKNLFGSRSSHVAKRVRDN